MKTITTIILLFITLTGYNATEIKPYHNDNKFTYQNLYNALKLCEGDPVFNFKLMVKETNGFKSRIFREENNLCGMHYPNKRATTAKGYIWGDSYGKSKVSVYDNWQLSVIDFIYYQEYYKSKGMDLTNYEKFISRYFNTNANYVKEVKNIKLDKYKLI